MKFCSVQGCKAPNFSIDKVTKLPYCKSHQTRRTDFDRRTILQKAMDKQKGLETKVRSLVNTSANLSVASKVKKVVDSELELWFKVRMNTYYPQCDNCGAIKESLPNWERGWKSCQAHLLPKKHFKSIRTHPLNGLILGSGFSGLCHCHDDYDHDWERASKMNIWPEVVRRFKILYPLIEQKEHQFIPQILLDTL